MTTLNVCLPGALDFCDSYSLIAIELIRNLEAMDVFCNIHALGDMNHQNCPPDISVIAHRKHRSADATLYFGYPSNIYKHEGIKQKGPRMICTMFESTRTPANFIEPCNQLDAVIVPSTFCADVFKSCGVTTPVSVIPLGLSDVYKPYRRPQRDKLTFLTFLDRGARKGGLAAQHAFLLAFGDRTDVHLVLKRRKPKVIVNFSNENMTMIQEDYTEEQMYELYKRADVMINPNKGEGFGLFPREFAATGGVALATDWSGTHDDIDEWGWGLPYSLVKADWTGNATLQGKDLGEWAEPSIEEISKILLDVADHRSDYIDAAWRKAQNVRNMYSWRAFAEGVLGVWRGVSCNQH